MRVAPRVELSAEDAEKLRRWTRSKTASVRLVQRAQIVLLAADGLQNKQISEQTGIHVLTVKRWRDRFISGGVAAIESDLPRSGRPRELSAAVEKQILELTQVPPLNATHWSIRRLAKRLEVAPNVVERVWKAHALQPHKVRKFKLSRDPKFDEKIVDVVGLYMDPPERSLVICVDEKTQIQALDRTRPLLKVRSNLPEHQTHDYKRNGTLDLYAALEVSTGRVIHQVHDKHRHQEFLVFLEVVDRETPADLDLHVILDNSSTHKTSEVHAWLAKHPRFRFHFTPTSSSWMNLVERVFGSLTSQRIRRGTFHDVEQLASAIGAWMRANNDDPKPMRWTKTAAEILRKVTIYRKTFAALH